MKNRLYVFLKEQETQRRDDVIETNLGLRQDNGEDAMWATAFVVHPRRRRRAVFVTDAQPTSHVIKRFHHVRRKTLYVRS